ncbi:MAG: hypothetical protein Q9219_000865 [cf. Caloplaca sp. 3 TL-2023]
MSSYDDDSTVGPGIPQGDWTWLTLPLNRAAVLAMEMTQRATGYVLPVRQEARSRSIKLKMPRAPLDPEAMRPMAYSTPPAKAQKQRYGTGITGGPGSGNKYTSGAQETGRLDADYGSGGYSGTSTDRHEPYSGEREYGSGATSGVGFGNKTSGSTESESSFGGNPEVARNSDPYTGHREYGSGATGGAGFGNKTSGGYGNEDEKGGGTLKRWSQERKIVAMERANRDVAALLQRFENIIEYDPPLQQSSAAAKGTSAFAQGDRNAAAVNAYRMEVETAALIRAAEDILSLTRMMKEMWLFGKVQTVGTNEADGRAEESAREVEEGLRRLTGAAGAGSGQPS